MKITRLSLMMFATLLSAAFYGCSSGSESGDIGTQAAISECGGFGNSQAKIISADNSPGALECGSETLQWSYDSEADSIKLTNGFVWLNCCGEHSIKAVYNESSEVYEIKEKDMPVDGDARCDCMCTFDFSIEFPAFGAERVEILLTREISDADSGKQEIYRGRLELSQGSGEVVIKEAVGYCE